MSLKDYFENGRGTGILSTADGEGRVNSAIYARPHVMEDGSIAFVMAERLSRHNLQSNPHAAYLFIEEGGGFRGKRLALTKLSESDDRELIERLRRRTYSPADEKRIGELRLVLFKLDAERPLIGAGPES
jgi:hypothetical protein